jgi:hypothetical protein
MSDVSGGENQIPAGVSAEDFYDAGEPLVAGRSCGTCTLCCKLYAIPELEKPAGAWCVHIRQGTGCTIYKDRPDSCHKFFCGWRLDPNLGPEWKPEQSRFILTIDVHIGALILTVDPGTPDAWKKEPYYSRLKMWAERAFPENKKIFISVSRKITAVLPDRDVPLGLVTDDEEITLFKEGARYGIDRRSKLPANPANSSSPIPPSA